MAKSARILPFPKLEKTIAYLSADRLNENYTHSFL